jgi:LVIVD repeat
MKWIFYLFTFLCFFVSCKNNSPNIGIVDAYVPIYATLAESENIVLKPAQPIVEGGKIAKLGQYLYQVENNKGIHIIDMQNPATPIKKGFISIPLCTELTLKGNYLYTNNMSDLVVINLSNVNTITVSSRIKNAFPTLSLAYPSQTNVYFECADLKKGLVIGWELKKVDNPKCKR